jgi:hypothetical protein
MEEEDARRPSRERECLVNERSRITNRMKSALTRLGVRGCDGGSLRFAMYFATVVCPTSMPSLSSSPWTRGAPPNGLATLIS